MEKAYLVLSDGTVLEGRAFGAESDAIGELVFNTGVVGYLEALTDPASAGLIVVQTYPLIGNYGVIPEDVSGPAAVRGYVVRELCNAPSNFRSEGDLDTWLKTQGIPGICGIDTRELTRLLRDKGVTNAMICRAVPEDLAPIQAYTVPGAEELADVQGTALLPASSGGARFGLFRWLGRLFGKKKAHPSVGPGAGGRIFRVTLLDYGGKAALIRALEARGCEVTVVPCNTAAESILAGHPHGVVLSDGPGDPAANPLCIGELQKLIGKVPVFGVGLGHQLAALAMGAATEKLPCGHRGANQPVRDVAAGVTYITAQNHGYAVTRESAEAVGRVIFENANDLSCEGLEYPGKQCFTVQFHPELSSGPRNTLHLFDRFITMMGGKL